jgi:hypothetical protein
MSRFRDILQHANDLLDLPQPLKSRILIESAADLEDAYQAFSQRGLDPETS